MSDKSEQLSITINHIIFNQRRNSLRIAIGFLGLPTTDPGPFLQLIPSDAAVEWLGIGI